MFGIDFIEGHNSLIVLGARFTVRSVDGPDSIYKWSAGPEGEYLQKENWRTGKLEKSTQSLVDVLPSSFGLDWKQRDFILALSFWCEGRSTGKAQARK